MGIEKQKALRVPRERKIFGYREAKALRVPRERNNFGYREANCSKNTHGKKNLWV